MDLSSLPVINQLSDHLSIVQKEALKIIHVRHRKASAAIALHGAHVLSYIPEGQAEVIWMSNAAILDGSTALRGGIPICWPWFGRIASPAHGFVRNREWSLLDYQDTPDNVTLTLGVHSDDNTFAIWPHQFALRLVVTIADTLDVRLEIENTDTQPWMFSGALHTYLNLGDVRQVKVTGMGREYIDSLQDSQLCQGGETLSLEQGIDRVYTQPNARISVADPELNRQIEVSNAGHNSAVLWNPWQEGAQAMADMQNDGYLTMLCVESTQHAKSIEEGITLDPNQTYTLSTSLTCR